MLCTFANALYSQRYKLFLIKSIVYLYKVLCITYYYSIYSIMIVIIFVLGVVLTMVGLLVFLAFLFEDQEVTSTSLLITLLGLLIVIPSYKLLNSSDHNLPKNIDVPEEWQAIGYGRENADLMKVYRRNDSLFIEFYKDTSIVNK